MFVDELEIFVQAGHGGRGCVSFRREKYVAYGGPDGGNGGDGGDVLIRVLPERNTLLPLRNRKHYRAGKGGNGKGTNRTGATGRRLVLEVPRGTIVRDRETGTIIGDLTKATDEIVAARGGRGGKGNKHFASATHRAPRFAQPGEDGEALWLKLELKLLADVGLVGFPNAGKSTLISTLSAAHPKVAAYPFTTLEPQLGVVRVDAFHQFVVADIPGIIEGAHHGAGLGLRFLKHIERTGVLLVLIDPTDPQHGPRESYDILLNELSSFSTKLRHKEIVVALTKADLPLEEESEAAALKQYLAGNGVACHVISAVRGDGLKDLVHDLYGRVQQARNHSSAELEENEPDHTEPISVEPNLAEPNPAEPVSPERDPLDEI